MVVVTIGSLIVAGQMSSLASAKGRAADNEHGARLDAQVARNQAISERNSAERSSASALAALKQADTERLRAEENFQRALKAVDHYFTQVSDSELLRVSGLQPLRRDLLSSALGFYEEYLKTHSEDPSLRSSLAMAHLKAARIYVELGQSADVAKAYQSALGVYESLIYADPANLDARGGLAECYLGLGTHRVPGRDAEQDLRKSVAIRETSVAAQPNDPTFRKDLARSFQALGDHMIVAASETGTQVEARLRDALGVLLKVRDIDATLVRDNPRNPDYQHALGRNLGQIAECLCRLGQHQNETIVRPLAIEHARTAFEQSPHVVAYGQLAARLLFRDGSNLYSQNRRSEGDRSFREAIALQLNLVRDNPSVPDLPSALFISFAQWEAGRRRVGELSEVVRS